MYDVNAGRVWLGGGAAAGGCRGDSDVPEAPVMLLLMLLSFPSLLLVMVVIVAVMVIVGNGMGSVW